MLCENEIQVNEILGNPPPKGAFDWNINCFSFASKGAIRFSLAFHHLKSDNFLFLLRLKSMTVCIKHQGSGEVGGKGGVHCHFFMLIN